MRKTLITALGLLAAARLSAGAFSGTIQYQLTSPKGATHELSLAMAGSKIRSEMTVGQHRVASIIDLKAHTLTTLFAERKAYSMGSYAAVAGKASKVTAVRTGATDTIAGYPAEEWKVTHGGVTSSVWMTQKLGHGFFGGSGPMQVDVPEDWKGKDLVMLRVTRPGGTKMEAQKVDTQAPDASLFSVPAGYTKLEGGFGAGEGAGAMGAERMREAMQSMSPEQRAAMQKMMNGGAGQ